MKLKKCNWSSCINKNSFYNNNANASFISIVAKIISIKLVNLEVRLYLERILKINDFQL